MTPRNLGRSGIKVSPICLGTMMFGGPTTEKDSARIIARAKDAGVNFIDTADVYTEGRSEEITGRAIKADRSHWVLATKLANPTGPGPNDRGLSRLYTMRAVEASLKRLGTDVIDIYYLHKEDHATPLEETVRAMGDLIRQGKIRSYGVSNHRSWRIAEICNLADRMGIDRPVVSQPYYNAMNRMPEVEHLPACGFYGLGVVPYSPLARGILSGKYDPKAPPPEGTRAGRADSRMMQTEWRKESLVIAQKLTTPSSPRPSRGRAPWSSSRTISARRATGSRRPMRLWSTGSFPPATPRHRAIPTRPIRWRGGWRGAGDHPASLSPSSRATTRLRPVRFAS
ncbi:MAG: aldo/keto reductase [Xanthobacteraceae bacterium]|nr:MAG: aldo/keto reductase [Xanthobacteraceae bacterium]